MLNGHRRLQIPWHGLSAALVLLAALGIGLRLRQYLFNRSLWLDEILLASNVIDREIGPLVMTRLADNVSAAPGFLVAVRSAVAMFGTSEYALRLVPLIAGLLVVTIAVILARHELKSAAAQVAFVGLVALSPVLIFYASEVKQYSSDAFFSLALLACVSYRASRYGTWLLAAIGFVALVCSLPAIFVAAPAALLILYEAIVSSRWRQTIVVGMAWSAGVALHAAYILQAGVDRSYMISWWGSHDTFAPFPPSSTEDILWYPLALSQLTFLSFRELGHAVPYFAAGWVDLRGWLLALAFVIALFAVIRSRRWTAIVAAGAILTTLLASMLEIYPFSSRLLIFLVPLTLFIMAAGVDELGQRSSLAAAITTLLLLSVVVPPALKFAIEPLSESDMRGALMTVNQDFEPGDAVAVTPYALYSYYRDVVQADDIHVLRFDRRINSRSVIDQARRNGYRRLWLVVAHGVRRSATRSMIKKISAVAPILSEWRARGTRVVLFDFTQR